MYYFKKPKYTSLHTYACGSMRVLCKCSQTQWLIPLATASHHKQFFFPKMYSLSKKTTLFCLHCCDTATLNWDAFFAQLGINNT